MNGGQDSMTTPTLGQHLEPEELFSYLLQSLTPDQAAVVEAHLHGPREAAGDKGSTGEAETSQGCALCLAELAALRTDLGAYAGAAIPLAEAPTRSRERLLQAIIAERGEQEPKVASGKSALGVVPGGKSIRASAKIQTRTAAAWLGWAVAAAVALVAVHFYQGRESMRGTLAAQQGQIAQLSGEEARAREIVSALTDRSAQRVTLTLTEAPASVQPTGRATYLPRKGTLVFLASHLQPLPAGKTYELWVIPANGSAPVAAGTFRPDERGSASVVTASLQPGIEAKAFGVTVEPDGGSATPTLPIVLAGS